MTNANAIFFGVTELEQNVILKEMYGSQHAPATDRLDPKISALLATLTVVRSSYLCCTSTLPLEVR